MEAQSARNDGRHPRYGGCDGFGPLGMCSECTDVIGRVDGTFVHNSEGRELTSDEAADMVRAFLLREVSRAALAAAMHTSEPRALSKFVEDVIGDVLPRSLAPAQGMQLREDSRSEAEAEGLQPGPAKQDAPTPCYSPTPVSEEVRK